MENQASPSLRTGRRRFMFQFGGDRLAGRTRASNAFPRLSLGPALGGAIMRPISRDWIPITEAIDVLAERFFNHVAEDWLAAYPAAWQTMERAMEGGETRARASTVRWCLEDSNGNLARNLDAQPNGELLQDFWHHFSAAKRIHERGLVTLGEGPGSHQSGNDVWFWQARGIVDNLHMKGFAEGVTIETLSLPRGLNTPRRRGRPQGRVYSDDQIVDRAAAVIAARNMTYAAAVKHFAPQMAGIATTASKAHRLRKDLAARGTVSDRRRSSQSACTSEK